MTEASFIRSKAASAGLMLDVLISPRASRSQLHSIHDGRVKILIAAPPAEGSANEALLEFMAKVLNIRKSAVSIEKGLSSRRKTLLIEGVSSTDLHQLIKKNLKEPK